MNRPERSEHPPGMLPVVGGSFLRGDLMAWEGWFYNLPEGRTKLLKECGFIKNLYDKNGVVDSEMFDKYYNLDKDKKIEVRGKAALKEVSADEEDIEVVVPLAGPSTYDKTGFPLPLKSYRLSWEVYDLSLEEPYFWVLDQLKDHFPIVEKIEDTFSASANSAFFGITQQRLGAQQDKVSQFLATTGKMIKELFQMVRELRILDERIEYYSAAEGQLSKPLNERHKGAEITLKGIFVDLVQGGGKSAASVYGMARELEFVTLPDLFFDAPPFKSEGELETHIKSLGEQFNKNVLRVLHRHLHQFIKWKERTYIEHKNRKRFMIAYLKQHFEIIRMYINWVKPYLRHVKEMSAREKKGVPDLISAFEGSMLDIEVLARKRDEKTETNACILATFNYRTRPEMKVIQEGYQRGPVHIGRYEMNLRIYFWNDQQVRNYIRLKDKEVLEYMGDISSSVNEAMESLGKELDYYLRQAAGETEEEKKEEEKPREKTVMERFLGDFYTPTDAKKKSVRPKEQKVDEAAIEKFKSASISAAKSCCWNTYKNFKKSRGMVAW